MYVLGAATGLDHWVISQMPDLTVTPGAISGPAAFAHAGIAPDDVDVLMAYDSFTITALLHLEDLGFCAKGEGGAFVEDGKLGPGGALPMNTNGGGLSYTHPGQYGMFLLVEATRQLRGECGQRQVSGRRGRGRARMRRRAVRHRHRRARHGGDAVTARRRAAGVRRGGPFWDATREQRFVLPWCTECERRDLVPAARPARGVSGRGSSGATRRATARCTRASIHWKPGAGRTADDGPYVVVLVDLDEGVRMMSNVVDVPPDDVVVGMPVVLAWEPLSDGRHLPVFRPA